MKPLTKEQELKIIKAAERVVDYVKQGDHPNDALYKVAREERLQPEFIKRLAEVFNTSRILAHFKSARPENRADNFPLADWGNVLSRLYPKVQKTANLNSWFAAPPDFNASRTEKPLFKEAQTQQATPSTDLEFLVKQAHKHLDSLKRDLDVLKTDLEVNKEFIRENLNKAAYYFRQYNHKPFNEVETNFLSAVGSLGKPLMDTLYGLCKSSIFNEPRGSLTKEARLFDKEEEPYNYLFSCIKFAKDISLIKAEYEIKKNEMEAFERNFKEKLKKLALLKRENKIPFPFKGVQKSSALKALFGYTLGRIENGKETPKSLLEIVNPLQEIEDKNLNIKLLLHDMLHNDPVISNYPEEDVIKAYNELLALSPRVAERPALARALLARRLELGHIDPFELAQVVKTEEKLKNIESGNDRIAPLAKEYLRDLRSPGSTPKVKIQ